MGAKETVLVCPILGEQRGEVLAVICLNGGGEGGQQIAKRRVSHLVVLISRDPSLDSTAVIMKEPIMASLTGPGALTGLKVIDLTRVLGGPYCTMVLSDHGAEVIKLEPPQGDETREWVHPSTTPAMPATVCPAGNLQKSRTNS
jgi:hypothetical protein